ncbi:hypothetical protein BGZ93_009650 [Podila epicladia]|nr:hypothetical protein BGZ92_010693 [Podila epicladia]KAG0089835.1 hypothetical protein BGZ93_009650 [Podila epicladia]
MASSTATTLLIVAGALAVPLLAKSLISKAPTRTTLIPENQERVVVIGASSGIGSELARIYAQRKAHVVLVARRQTLLESLVQELSPVAGSILAIQGDVTLPEDVRRITLESLRFLKGGVDTLILCAGMISVLPFTELAGTEKTSTQPTGDDLAHLLPSNPGAALDASIKIMNLNYHAPLNLTSHFLPALTQTSRAGNIIVVSSMAGKLGAPTRSIYCGSKHAAQGFFDSLGMEVEKTGVHVGIVSPGTVETDLRQSAVDLPSSSSTDSSAAPKATGTKKGAMTARACAEGIVRGSDLRQHEVIMPWFYHVSLVLQMLSPSLVRWLAKKKYGYLK